VDFVLSGGNSVVALEIKSGRARDARAGMAVFSEAFKPARKLLVGGDGIDLETFLLAPAAEWLQ